MDIIDNLMTLVTLYNIIYKKRGVGVKTPVFCTHCTLYGFVQAQHVSSVRLVPLETVDAQRDHCRE